MTTNPAQKRVAFLMPVYQAQQDFDDTMESLARTTTPCTVFAVDDGSRPPLELRDYGPSVAARLIRLPGNQGIVAALNTGLKAALDAGFEYIARIDAGDYIRPHRLARQIEYLDKHPRCMLVGSDAEVRDEQGTYLFTIEPPREPAALARALHERAWLLHPSVMFRASLFSDTDYYSDEFTAAEDYEMFLRIASRHEVGVVPETLLIYIIRNRSITGKKGRVQVKSRLRIQFRYLKWNDWFHYYGAFRTAALLLIPHGVKNALKLRFLYSRQAARATDSPHAI